MPDALAKPKAGLGGFSAREGAELSVTAAGEKMIVRLCRVLSTFAFIILPGAATAENVELDGVRAAYKACHALPDSSRRLACYEALFTKLEPPTFEGYHTEETPLFKIDRPTLLRYQSDGPIFVMYLKDENGSVVQNLHIGGGGESKYLIQKAGSYSLQVSATDTWRVWLEPSGPHG